MNNLIRLDKFLSQATTVTRSESKRIIGKGWVKVNGEVNKDASAKIDLADEVVYKREVISLQKEVYIVLHKPAGYICSAIDEQHPTALNLLNDLSLKDLHFAGRLDVDTTGLVLITNNGKWSHRIASPRKKCEKVYRVWLAEAITDELKIQLEEGVQLNGEDKLTEPAKLEVVDPQQVLLTITQGRYHQVKRMFAALNNRVERLHREQVGPLSLMGLAEGESRHLTASEVMALS